MLVEKEINTKQVIKKVIKDGKMLVRIGETREIKEYEFVEIQGKFYMFRGKGGYIEAFTPEQIYSNWKNLNERERRMKHGKTSNKGNHK